MGLKSLSPNRALISPMYGPGFGRTHMGLGVEPRNIIHHVSGAHGGPRPRGSPGGTPLLRLPRRSRVAVAKQSRRSVRCPLREKW